jgi:SEC-C motif
MNDTTVVRTRRIDNGDPLLLVDPPPDDGAAAYTVSTAICDNPQCACTRMWLDIRPTTRAGDGMFEIQGPALAGEVSADGSDLTLDDDTTGVFSTVVTEWLRAQLSNADRRAWLRERWRRARGQVGDPAYPSGVPPQRVDGLVSFCEVFPYDFDLTVVHDRHLYLADDQYCLEPACTCDEMVVYFVDVSQGGQGLGHVRASVRRLRAATTETAPGTRPLWHALLKQNGHSALRERFKRMRAVAQSRARSQRHVVAPKLGRNAPCPCGSGRKFKRCCGA